ncbi:MAG: ATP-dependent Clp protease ATP-binding subunit ClpX, partial [Paludibacteraceae bacterium]|nr:ATP-dependent Clp protease ATP-binding subunit ClpX [Paludibacteraceae bacterium]
ERKISQRMNTQTVGFAAQQAAAQVDKNNLLQYIAPQDLKSYGLIPEIIGRLPVLTYLRPLDKEALRNILTEPKNALTKQYQKLLAMDNVKLVFDDTALDYIVEKALEYKLGARGLRGLMEAVMMDLMFDLPSHKKDNALQTFTVTKEYAKEKLEKVDLGRLKNAV